jgi:outer membrane lipoprotein-sorting protein
MNRFAMRGVGVVAVLFGAGTVLADTLESVEKTIIEKAGSLTAYQGKMVSTQNMQNPQMKYEAQNDMTYECLKKGDKWLYRTEGKTKSVSVVEGQEQKQDVNMLIVCDGQFVWTLTDANGQKNVMKTRPEGEFSMVTDKTYFENMQKDYDLKLMPDETVDGKPAWVIQATSREPATEGDAATMITYFDKETGISIKTVGKDTAGKVIMTSVTKDVKVNAAIPADRFVFKAPEGVPVMDLTQQEMGSPEKGATEPAAPAPKDPKADKKP